VLVQYSRPRFDNDSAILQSESVIVNRWVGNRLFTDYRSPITFTLCNLHRKFQSICPESKTAQRQVREVFDLGETLLFVVTDRISAFDVIPAGPDSVQGRGA